MTLSNILLALQDGRLMAVNEDGTVVGFRVQPAHDGEYAAASGAQITVRGGEVGGLRLPANPHYATSP